MTSDRSVPYVREMAELQRLLDSGQDVLVASHIDPDGDALGTQLAFAAYLRDLGKNPILVRDDIIPEKYRFLPGVNDIPLLDTFTEAPAIDTALILECPTTERIGRARKFLEHGATVLNVDHHQDNGMFGKLNWLNVASSSVGEMAFEFFNFVGYKLSPNTAESLYTAILTDTGRFRFSSTSPRTMQIAGELIAAGADPQHITDMVYFDMRASTIKLIGKVLNDIEFSADGRICLLTMTREALEQSGAHESESDGLVDYTLFSGAVEAGALLKEISDTQTKASLRSRDGINVAAIAAGMGGGGHYNAAGCTIDRPLPEAKKLILELISKAIHGVAE